MVSGAPASEISPIVVTLLMKPLAVDDLLDAVKRALAEATPRPRVLLVEDDVDLARVLVESFDRIGAESRHAATGREAIDFARSATPDLIVLDLSLPDLDGFAVVDYFKDHGLMTGVPLVVYSRNEPKPSERDRLRLGPTEFLTKSRVSPEAFETHIARLLAGVHETETELSHVA
jgi:CheY-like chemotaxis protein